MRFKNNTRETLARAYDYYREIDLNSQNKLQEKGSLSDTKDKVNVSVCYS